MPRTPDFSIKAGARQPPIVATLGDDAGVVDLTAATAVRFRMWAVVGGAVKVGQPGSFVGPRTGGQVSYAWAAADTDTPGDFFADWLVTWADGTTQAFPTDPDAPNLLVRVLRGPG